MRGDAEFEGRARAIVEGLLSGPVNEAVSPLEVDAAVTALDAARAECQQRRVIALVRSVVRVAAEATDTTITDEEFAAIPEISLRQAVGEWSECGEAEARMIALAIVAGLNADLGGEWTVESALQEFLA